MMQRWHLFRIVGKWDASDAKRVYGSTVHSSRNLTKVLSCPQISCELDPQEGGLQLADASDGVGQAGAGRCGAVVRLVCREGPLGVRAPPTCPPPHIPIPKASTRMLGCGRAWPHAVCPPRHMHRAHEYLMIPRLRRRTLC